MTHRSKVTVDSTGIEIYGTGMMKDDQTFLREIGRVADLASYTVIAKAADSKKWVPLTDVDPAVVPGSLACGAIGGSLADFAALASASFKIGFDGEAVIEVVCDFSGIDTEEDTPGYYTCGANGAIIAAGWDAIADGAMTITVNGVAKVLAGVDFTDATTFDEVVETLNFALEGHAICTYDADSNIFKFTSPTTGETSTVAALAAGAGGTDISAAGYLNGAAAGAATAGTGGEGLAESIVDIINAELAGRGECSFDGDKFIFWSNSTELGSAVSYLTAGTVGTDISGAAYLNGLTGTGVITAATTSNAENIPAGLFWGDDIAAASLAAADVTNQRILIGGDLLMLDEDKVVLENSLDLDDIVTATGKSIRQHLEALGIYTRGLTTVGQVAPI